MREEPYVIIKANCSSTLIEEVNDFLNKYPSFRPLGGVCGINDVLYQTLFSNDVFEKHNERKNIISE